ncbi:hypothetical protein QNH10_14125 [Sporosarcina thermotolerans]|uniref:hypothetical protein n=1 Tax=Sporosarcina thermotolerans TaxID=633404 RepID=UPI0024BD50BB|nr:hypothetical protein [Sporosarcina thermotolerans]WHT47333.1 hypothetical protein QNH10_14125 [Sporosarcina thermotolerans]
MSKELSQKYYKELVDLENVEGVESQFLGLLDVQIESVSDLEKWLEDEKELMFKINEAITGHHLTSTETQRIRKLSRRIFTISK